MANSKERESANLDSTRREPAPITPSQLAFILEVTPDGVLSIDASGGITSANAAAGRILGTPPDELIDRPIARFIRSPDETVSFATRLAERAEIQSEEIEVTRANGERAWLSISARTQGPQNDDGRAGAVVFVRDVTERRESRYALERKNQELESYARNVSHDLRNPLVSILGFTRLLKEDHAEALGETGLHFLDRIEQAGRNMEQLLHDLLELSRIAEMPRILVRVDPDPILRQLHDELKLKLEDADIALVLPEHPPAILCDRTRLYQLFSNLIGNALHHMGDRHGGRIEVEIDAIADGWEIAVRDNGPGIAAEDRERIFGVFEKGRHPARSRSRSGLGLAIVKKIVESHAGRIRVESELGAGTRFVVSLPASAGGAALGDDP